MSDGGKVEHLDESSWQTEVLASKIPIFVEFSATWCGPCHAMAPIISELAEEFDGRVRFVDVDVDKNPVVASRFEVFSVPTFVVLVKGKTRQRFVGMATRGHMAKLLESSIGA